MHRSYMQRSFVCMSNTCNNCVHRSCMQISCMQQLSMHTLLEQASRRSKPQPSWELQLPLTCPLTLQGKNFSFPALTQLETHQHWEKVASGRMRQQEREKTKLTGSSVLYLSGRWVVLLHYAHPAVPHSLHFLFGTSLKTFCCLPAAVFSGAFLCLSPAPEHPITPHITLHIRHLQCSFFF